MAAPAEDATGGGGDEGKAEPGGAHDQPGGSGPRRGRWQGLGARDPQEEG